MKKTVFIKNAAILTAASLAVRFAGIIFKVWLAAEIGAQGIGLYQLIFSVYVFASTFASSGISTAVTRLVTEERALGSKNGISKIMRRAVELTLIVALISCAAVYFGADFIAFKLLSDIRAVRSLKILCFSLPFMGLASCFKGYFISARKAAPSAVSQIIEQTVRIAVTVTALKAFENYGVETACSVIIIGDTLAEVISAIYLYLLFIADKKSLDILSGRKNPDYPIVKSVISIAGPITSGRYLNSGLRTLENLLVPKCLAKFSSNSDPLGLFGMIKGMALPILFFPSALLNAISTLLIPEISEAMVLGNGRLLKSSTEKILRITSSVGYIFAAIFAVAGREIGLIIYKSSDVGFLLCALSPIVPLMYLDSISDGILKGLDQQKYIFRTGLGDCSIRIILVALILPKFGIWGFIAIMYFSNLLTCFLNVKRLLSVSGAELSLLKEIVIPLSAALFSVLVFKFLLSFVALNKLVYVIALSALSVIVYFAVIFLSGSLTLTDIGLKPTKSRA